MKIYNHTNYSLSKLDLEMVKSVPMGGNWQNIPLHIPSKRLERIRETGGRTTLYGRLSWKKPSFTITTYFSRPGNGTYIHPVHNRVITAREAARIQSFPDDFIFTGSKRSLCVQIGNAVPPLLAYSIAKQIKKETKARNVVDLFCGAGGLSKGFQWAGFNIVAANDNMKEACSTYRINHPNTKLIEGSVVSENIKQQIYQSIKGKKIDIIMGGPPCQGFSYAGKRFVDDHRNFLFKEFVEIVSHIKPTIILMENVEGILTSNSGKTFQSIKDSFKEIGYILEGKKIYAADFGVPQKRKRIVLIGVKKGDPSKLFPEPLINNENDYVPVEDAIKNLSDIAPKETAIETKLKYTSNYEKLMANLLSPSDYIKNI